MEISIEELFPAHYAVKNYSEQVINMLLPLPKPKPKDSNARYEKIQDTSCYIFRKRPKSNRLEELLRRGDTLEDLCKLLCKPVIVNVTKLSISEIKQWCKKDLYQSKAENILTQKKKFKPRIPRTKFCKKKKKSKQEQLSCLYHSENENKPQNMLFSKKAEIENKNCIKNLLEDIKQPQIKLQRIDEVINKIAQSFARVTPIKECETRCETSIQTEETQTELSISAPKQLKLSSVNIDRDKYQQNLKTETIAIRSHANETLQLNKCADSDSDSDSDFNTNSDFDSNTGNSRNTNERRHRIIYNSHTDNNNRYNKSNANNERIISNKLKRLRENSSKKISKINLVNEKYNIIKKRYTDKNSLSQAPQRPSILDRISALCDPDDDDDDESTKEGNTSSCVPSKLNLDCIIEDGTSVKGKNEDAMTIEKPIVENKKIEEQIQESFPSDRNFTQRYKLFKELKVLLIKFDALKDSNTTYSATEVEKMTERFMNSYVNSNSSKLQNINKKSTNNASFISIISKDSNVNIEKSTEATKHDSRSSIDSIPNKDVYTTTEGTQSTIKLPKFSEKLFPNLIRNAKIQQERSSQFQKACHNLTKIFEDSYRKRFAQNTINNAKKKLIVPTPTTQSTLLCSSQKSTNKTSELSNVVENINNIDKSTGKTFSLKKKIPKISSPKENSMKLVIDARSQEQVAVDTSKVTNFKLHLSKKNKKHESEKHTSAPKTCGKTTNVTTTKIATKKSASTSYSSIVSPKKHKRLRDNHGYKCIVCDLCFEDYSDLQQHLITHTQKQNNSLANSLKTSNMSPEKSQDMISQSSETEISEPSQVPSEHKSEEHTASQYVTKKENGQQKKKDAITKSFLSKEKRKKRIKRINNSNKCSICSKPFESMADLAAHIFLHTEKELQQAYKLAKQKLNKTEKYKQTRTERKANSIKNINSTVNIADNKIERTQKVNDKEETLLIKKPLITEDPEIRDTESITMKENYLQDIELCLPAKSKKDGNKKSFTVCECHNKPGTNENCLQIEIVLLCHTCRVLFRSMKCFETHYRLPQYVKCNQNRLTSGRSPNLFCATCGMIFSSVQDVRHHLEIHARFKKDYTMDFRCNICKIIFLGIGSLFYIHWSKHSRNSFWMASEKSFPKDSILNLKLTKAENSSTENEMTLSTCVEKYIEVAEHVCCNCKLPFITQDGLRNHILECTKFKSVQDASIAENSNTCLAIRITCNLCDDTFINKKTEFYKHLKDKHNLSTEPRFICTSFTARNIVFICSVCTAMTKSLNDFEDHWLKHNTTHVYFTCLHCTKIYHNSLHSFIDHAKRHTIDANDVVSCVVSYEQTKFSCKFCNIGFDSSQSMQDHAIIHDTNSQQISPKISQVTNQDSSAKVSETDCASNFAKFVELTIEKGIEELKMETQTMENANEICPIESSIDKSRERLIRILEGNEDDSEHELVIDLTKQSEECNEELKEEGSKERQTTSNFTLDKSSINQTCVTSENNKANELVTNVNIQVSSQNVAKSKTQNVTDSLFTAKNINPQISNSIIKSTNILQPNNVSNHNNLLGIEKKTTSDQSITKDIESTQNVEVHDRISIINQEESTILTKETSEKLPSPPKPRQGFLRVKTLAELTGSANLRELSNCTVENANELAKHFKSHHASNKDNNEHKTTEKELVSKQPAINKFIANKKLTIVPKTNSNTLLLSSSNSGNIKLVIQNPVMKSNTTVINNQQPQQFQINTNQNEHSSSLENVTSAYHKNLPACNFVRTTTAMPRFTILKPIKVVAHTANIPNVQRTHVASCSTNENKQKSSSAKKNSGHTVHECNSAEFLMDNLSGNHSTCEKQYLQNDTQAQELKKFGNSQTIPTINTIQNNPNPKQCQQTTMKQPGINYESSSICDQYSYVAAGTSNNSNQILEQNQPIITNHPITENTTPIYYKNPNPSNGGMSIVINQTTPTVQNIPTIGILQQPAQQQINQQQDLVQFSESNTVFQLANQPSVATYQVRYVCPYCSESFVSENYMQMHINKQHNFICDICSLRLYSFSDLNLHKIQHSLL